MTEYPSKPPPGERYLSSGCLRTRFRYQNHQQKVPLVSSQCHGAEARFFPSSETCLAISGTQFLAVRRSLESSVSFSPFLTNFPQRGFASPASHQYSGIGTIRPLTPAVVTPTTGLPACLAQTSQHSASNHEVRPSIALAAIPACWASSGLRRE